MKLQEQQRKRLAESEIRLQLIKEGVIREGEEISVHWAGKLNTGMRSVLSMPSSSDERKPQSANVPIALQNCRMMNSETKLHGLF